MLRSKVARGLETRGSPGPQPGGVLKRLKWDRILARIAQTWANQCLLMHDPCRDVSKFAIPIFLEYILFENSVDNFEVVPNKFINYSITLINLFRALQRWSECWLHWE